MAAIMCRVLCLANLSRPILFGVGCRAASSSWHVSEEIAHRQSTLVALDAEYGDPVKLAKHWVEGGINNAPAVFDFIAGVVLRWVCARHFSNKNCRKHKPDNLVCAMH